MPYDIIKVEGKYRVFAQGGKSKTFGTHDTRQEAEAQMRALKYSEEPPQKPVPGTQAGKGFRLNSSYEPEAISEVYVDGKKINTER